MRTLAIAFTFLLLLTLPALAAAEQCEMVTTAGKAALEKGDLAPALELVQPDQQQELRDTFLVVNAARAKGGEVKEAADRLFLQTLDRLHHTGERAGEAMEKDCPMHKKAEAKKH